MRLVCPNCGAQYEVDDRVIPDAGRDVQCSACGHGWYQLPLGREAEVDDADEPGYDDRLSEVESEEEADDIDVSEDEAQADWDIEAEPGPDDEEEEVEADLTPPAAALAAKPRDIDEGIRSILREEADRELAARATEARPEPQKVETQPDLGLDAGPSPEEERRRIARERMARMRGIDEDELPEPDFDAHAEISAEPEKPSQGRDLFPDIEEINSTLDNHAPGAVSGPAAGHVQSKARGGFGRAFTLVIALAALLLAVYILAPRIASLVPALEPSLAAYVEAVNVGRVWLDETLRGFVEKIEAAATGSAG